MFKVNDQVKAYFLGIITVILVLLICSLLVVVIDNVRKDRVMQDKDNYHDVYGTVIKKSGDYIVIKPIDEELGEEIRVQSDLDVNKGDFVLVDDGVSIIASNNEIEDFEQVTTTTTTVKSTSISRTTTKTSTTNKVEITTTTVPISNDELVLTYVENVNTEVNTTTSLKDSIKSGFITVVDFIFYNGEIKGVTWNELTTSAKAKVLYYALLIDSKIDSKWPNYKEEIGSKVTDLKEKLIAKYMEITTNLCNNNKEACTQAKSDFQLLKTSLGLTWDIVKTAFKYGYDKTTDYLRTWYEVFSGKVS